ncbi:MAG: hypothetical protein ACK5U0_06585, partial [Gemmatimonas sp.]
WHPWKIELQVERFARGGPTVGAVYTWSTYTDATGRILPGRAFTARFEGDVYAQLLVGNFVNGTHMVRTVPIAAYTTGGRREARLRCP